MRLLLIFQSVSQIKDRKLYDETGAQNHVDQHGLAELHMPPVTTMMQRDYSEMIGYMAWRRVYLSLVNSA